MPKLSRATGMLAKIRHYVPKEILFNIYHAIFNSHLTYGSLVWSQTTNELIKKIGIIQNKAIRIINFKPPRESADKIYLDSKILKFEDQIKLANCLLVYHFLNNTLPDSFQNFFIPVKGTHDHSTK